MLLFNQSSLKTSGRLTLFAVICLSSVSGVYYAVQKHIAEQYDRALLSQFQEIVPAVKLSATFLQQAQSISLKSLPITLYDAHGDNGRLIAHFIRAITNKGYAGTITLLIAIAPDNQTLLGVRTLEHHETPGLGDKIDRRISNWIDTFSNTTLTTHNYAVKKTAATLTHLLVLLSHHEQLPI